MMVDTYRDRDDAARQLAWPLEHYRAERPLVLAIPRGAVPMAKVIADELGTDMDIVLVRKIGAPGNPEYGVGSVSEFGDVYLTEAVEAYGIPEEYVNETAAAELAEIHERRKRYSANRPPLDPAGRTVIIVDDGIATGSTMVSAVRSLRAREPRRIVVATPVASQHAVDVLSREADEVVVLQAPELFFSVGGFYEDFSQVSDEEVIRIMNETRGPGDGARAA